MNKTKKSKLPFIIGGAIVGVAAIVVALIVGGNKSDRINCKHDDPSKIVTVEAVAPTCRATGLTEGMKCSACETMVVPQKILQKIDCIESDWIIDLESTLTEDGKKHTECTMCGKTFKQDVIPSGGKLLEYTLLDNNTYQVIGIGDCQDKDVVIPSKYNGLPVTSIGEWAFYNCSSLTIIEIPDSVTSIGEDAFFDCSSLTSIEIPDSVTSIGRSAFFDCSSLTSIEIPDSVTSIGRSAFSGCYSLTSITLPFIGATKTEIITTHFGYIFGASSFDNNNSCVPSSLKEVVVTGSRTKIKDYAFFGCTSLTSIVIGDSVTSIGNSAFENCPRLTSVVIGDSVTSIGDEAFQHCKSLTSIKYRGTQSQWNAISKGNRWDEYYDNGYKKLNYTITYNYTGE